MRRSCVSRCPWTTDSSLNRSLNPAPYSGTTTRLVRIPVPLTLSRPTPSTRVPVATAEVRVGGPRAAHRSHRYGVVVDSVKVSVLE